MRPASFLRSVRALLVDVALLAGVCSALLAPSASRAAVISQSITFDSIKPFGTFSTGTFTTGGWSAAFPVNNIASVERFWVSFSSTDAAYLAQQGPLGGVPWIEFGYLDDSLQRHAFASMGLGYDTVSFGAENPGHFAAILALLADGELTVAPGGYEGFADHSDDFTFGRTSTLTLWFELPEGSDGGGSTPGDVPGIPTSNVPEPGALALVLLALGAAALVASRPGKGRPSESVDNA